MQIVWSNEYHLLNYPRMDKVHREFIDIYNSVNTEKSNIKDVLEKLYDHTKTHFALEEEEMVNYNYPRIYEHKQEHQRVLWEMEYFLNLTNSLFGKNLMKKYFTDKLPEWFALHLANLDSDLSAYIKNKNTQKVSN